MNLQTNLLNKIKRQSTHVNIQVSENVSESTTLMMPKSLIEYAFDSR